MGREAEKDAPSGPNVLAQTGANSTDYRFPVAVANAPSVKDGKVSVKCKPVSGKVDQACGVVFRYQDENNYYVARANALEDNVNLYFVKGGKRKEIKGFKTKVASGVWHELTLEAKGDHLEVSFDGKKMLEATDKNFVAAGKAGVWTKADSVTYFDDMTIAPQ